MKRIAVLMTCFNRREKTLHCLNLLYGQALMPDCSLKVYLVDDASTDGTADAVRENFPAVEVIAGTGDLFWCRGMRAAWDAAGDVYDAYLWLNDDTFILPGCLNAMLRTAAINPGAIVSGRIADPISGKVVYGGDVRALNGNVLLVPKSAYQAIGPIDSHFHHRYGDYDYGIRARLAGIPIELSDAVVGTCTFNPGPTGKTSGWSLARRWKSLFLPTEFHLGDAYYYSCKHKGITRGVLSVVHIFLKVMTGRA